MADDTALLQSLIDQTPSGGCLELKPISYVISSGLSRSAPINIYGNGANIVTSFATGSALTISRSDGDKSWATLADLIFSSSVTRTADYYVNLSSSQYISLNKCLFWNAYYGLGITGEASAGLRVKDCRFEDTINTSILVAGQSGSQGLVDAVIEDVLISGYSASSQSSNGIYVACAGDLTLRHVSTIFSGHGLNISPTTGQIVQALIVSESFFDSGSGHGITVQPSGSGQVSLMKFSNTWSASNACDGMVLSGAGSIKQTDINNCTFSGNSGNGLTIANAATNTKVTGSSMSQNAHGIAVAANTNKFSLIGNTCGASGQFSGNTGWGIVINGGTSNEYIASLNRTPDNGTGGLSDGGSGATKYVAGNI